MMRCDASAGRRHGRAGFTMIEIALCLAIIGFAIVAIISALPTGLNVQKDNREETIINEDAAIWLDAIRNGAKAYDNLTNYVLGITNVWAKYDDTGKLVATNYDGYSFDRASVTSTNPTPATGGFRTGFRIIGLLSTPKYTALDTGGFQSNYVVAYVRSISGPAVDKAPQDNQTVLEAAFTYRMIVENAPYVPFDTNALHMTIFANKPYDLRASFDPDLADLGALTNTEPTGLTPPARQAYWDGVRANRRLRFHEYANSRDIRLTFRWPILPTGETGNGRHTFRVFTTGRMVDVTDFNQILFFFEPSLPVSLGMR